MFLFGIRSDFYPVALVFLPIPEHHLSVFNSQSFRSVSLIGRSQFCSVSRTLAANFLLIFATIFRSLASFFASFEIAIARTRNSLDSIFLSIYPAIQYRDRE